MAIAHFIELQDEAISGTVAIKCGACPALAGHSMPILTNGGAGKEQLTQSYLNECRSGALCGPLGLQHLEECCCVGCTRFCALQTF